MFSENILWISALQTPKLLLCDMTPRSLVDLTSVSEEYNASIFSVKKISMKAECFSSTWVLTYHNMTAISIFTVI
jgi:hypothetical protein